ncbi:MAG: hypothetical protein HQL35_10640 [Alphaproteobacteria bacterium]|nr:hypothetical protein [Alphaproteobacteria bacterium]
MSTFLAAVLIGVVLMVLGAALARRARLDGAQPPPPAISDAPRPPHPRTPEQARDLAEHRPSLEIEGELDAKPNGLGARIHRLVNGHPGKAVGVLRRWMRGNSQ